MSGRGVGRKGRARSSDTSPEDTNPEPEVKRRRSDRIRTQKKDTSRDSAKQKSDKLKPSDAGCSSAAHTPRSKPVLLKEINVKTESDEKEPELQDILVLMAEGIQTIIVTDMDNHSLKSFYTRNNKPCHSVLQLESLPWCLAQLNENQVMVTLPNICQIITVAVSPDLVLVSAITTPHQYDGLAVLSPSTIIAGAYDSSRIDILNMEGQVMKSVSTNEEQRLFNWPWYMCVDNKGNLLVTDGNERDLTCVTLEGDIVWKYSPSGKRALWTPRGVTTTSEGEILLVDRNTQKVTQLTESGKYIRDILTAKNGLRLPYGIHMDKSGSLFLGDGKKIKEFKFT